MSDQERINRAGQDLEQLHHKVEQLVALCGKLQEEVESLREQQDQLVQERSHLVQVTDQARTRVESMINRLKALEQKG